MAGRRGSKGGGGFEPPRMADAAREGLRGRFAEALHGNRAAGALGHLVNLLGGRGRGGGTGKLADKISRETGEKRSAVIRQIQRALKGEGKGPQKGGAVVEKELRGNAAQVMRAQNSINVTMKVSITVSSETYPTMRTARAHLTGGAAAAFANAVENGDDEAAANIVFGAYWGEQAGGVDIHEIGEINF